MKKEIKSDEFILYLILIYCIKIKYYPTKHVLKYQTKKLNNEIIRWLYYDLLNISLIHCQMAFTNFTNYITENTFHDALITYQNHFESTHRKLLFDNCAIEYKTYDMIQLSKLNIINIGWHRFKDEIHLAYPENDRPRGQQDIDSVLYHLKIIDSYVSDKWVPPIIFDINETMIFMDGMHRLVALNIRKKPFVIAVFGFTK